VTDEPYGLRVLPAMYEAWTASGMIGNIGSHLVDVGRGTLVLEAVMSGERHGFPTSRGVIVHGGAIATLADEALATVAFTLAEEGEATATSSLHVDYYKPAIAGKLIARASVRHRTKRLAYCHASIEQEDGQVVAEGRAVIAYVRG
jgi:uncharacterized protein (TIGR00369 family)